MRTTSELPFYCRPLSLFVFVWVVMLALFQFRISYAFYPSLDVPLILFVASFLSVFLGFSLVWAAYRALPDQCVASVRYVIDDDKLRRLNGFLFWVSLMFIGYNLAIAGPPPLFGFFGFDTPTYAEYGRFKQFLFPMLMALFVNAWVEKSPKLKWFYASYPLAMTVLYVTRGFMLFMLLQALFVFSIRTKLSRARIYGIAVIVMSSVSVVINVLGNNRTAQDVFFSYLQIKEGFRPWPMLFLWIISYVSLPLSNMCWIFSTFHFHGGAASFLYPMLPSFWTPESPHYTLLQDSHLIDGVHTYLATYYLDFSILGIVCINVMIGMIAGYLLQNNRISRQFLTSSIFLACIAFIFFWDFFVFLPTAIELCIQAFAQKYIIREV